MKSRAFRHDDGNAAPATGAGCGASPTEHRFSESYQQRRRALVAEYGGAQEDSQASGPTSSRFRWRTAAIAAAAALVVVPVSAWAVASNADFFAGAFGGNARTSVQAHDEVQGYKDGKPVMVTYPTREYVEADLETAERLLGPYTAAEETKVQMGEHTLTIQSAVRDKDTMVVAYTLERPGGVTALEWDELTNQGKGARRQYDEPYLWEFVAGTAEKWKAEALAGSGGSESPGGESGERPSSDDTKQFRNWGSGCVLVDPERSTADELHCYEYLIFQETPAEDVPVTLQVVRNSESGSGDGSSEVEQRVELPVRDALAYRALSAEGVGIINISPISLNFLHSGDGDVVDEKIARADYDKYFGERFGSFEDFLEGCYSETDIDACSKAVVRYKDGSEYTVFDDVADLDNTANAFGRDGGAIWMFNRLVNPQEIESVTINDVTFS